MKPIKTYQSVHPDQQSYEFRWTDMQAVYETRGGTADVPHSHAYYTIIIIRRGEGQHRIDFEAHPLGPYQIYFITPGQVHQLLEQAPTQGVALVFSPAFLRHTQLTTAFIEDLQLFRTEPLHAPLTLEPKVFERVWADAHRMRAYTEGQHPYRFSAIGALLQLLLLECYQHCTLPAAQASQWESGQGLVQQFRQLVEQHHTEWHHVADYAEALHVTPDHLNRTLKQLLGSTAKNFLQDRLIVAAKRLLFFTDQPAKSVGYALGFNEPANFSAFFKRCTGLSPTAFRAAQAS